MTGILRATLNKYALGTALALVVAPLAVVESAEAACTPATSVGSPVNDNPNVTCTGATANQNAGVGWGTAREVGNTITVVSGATVTGINFGIDVDTGNTIANSGTISAGTFGIHGNDGTTLHNSGTITGVVGFEGENQSSQAVTTVDNSGSITGSFIGVAGSGQLKLTSNTGAISGGGFGISADNATIANSGRIEATGANGVAIGNDAGGPATNLVTLDNGGKVEALGSGGIALRGQTVTVNSNTGDILANSVAIEATTANVTNAKNIAGGVVGINARAANVNNLAGGVITGGLFGIFSDTVVLKNAGNVAGTNGTAVFAGLKATVDNSGQIVGTFGVGSQSVTLTNSGSIAATTDAAVVASTDATIVNLAGGSIQGTTQGIHAGTLNLMNAGMISGATAVKVETGPAVITNFGTIQSTAGATGTAIQLSGAADTLNVKRGSSIIGLIDFGHGADVINVDSTEPQVPKGVSMLSRATSAVVDALRQQLVNFDGIINIIGGGNASLQPTVTANGQTASLDPTALAQQDRTLMDFTGGMSSMVQGRLGGGGAGAGPQAMSYAMEDPAARIFNKAPAPSWSAPVNVWSSVFGGVRSQNGTDTTLNSSSNVFGGVIGIDRRIRPDWLIGAFAGGGSGALNVDLGSQKVDTDYFSAGAYSRFEWASQFLDTTLQVGGVNNRSSRLLQNNITGGLEHATASYNGWFISPEIAYGYRVNLGNGAVMTPMLRARYVAGFFDGYNETGSAQTLSIGSRTLQDFEERAELEFAKTGFFGDPSLKGWFRGGAIALQRTGNTNINAVLIGQNLSFLTPGRGSAVGGVGSVGFDYHVGAHVVLFGSLDGTMMSDESRTASAKGGMRVAF